MVSKYLTEAGIRDASVHSLRHTFGTHTVKRGTKLRVVQEVLGHASLKTTSLDVQLAREDMDRSCKNTRWKRNSILACDLTRPGQTAPAD